MNNLSFRIVDFENILFDRLLEINRIHINHYLDKINSFTDFPVNSDESVEEFDRVWMKETMFRDKDLLIPQMGQFQQYYGKLFVHQGPEQGWQLIKGVKL